MSKRIYRAVSIKRLDVDFLLEVLAEVSRVILGCDAAKDRWQAAFMLPDGQVVQTIRWDLVRDHAQVMDLLERIRAAGIEVEVAIEPTGTYADAFVERLLDAGFPVFAVNPKHSHDYSEIYDGVPSSHDGKSSAVVAKLHLERRDKRPWHRPDEGRRDLRAATDAMGWIKEDIQREQSRLHARLARHWPEVTKLVQLDTATLRALMVEFGGPAGVVADPEGARECIDKASRGKVRGATVEKILESARTTIGCKTSPWEEEALRRIGYKLQQLWADHRELEHQLRALCEADRCARRLATGTTFLGATSAVAIVAHMGDLADYESTRMVQRQPGLNLTEHSSGIHKGRRRISKRGSPQVRKILYLAVLRWLQMDRIARSAFDAKADRGNTMKAAVFMMRKLIAGLRHVARGETFDSTRLFDVPRLQKLGYLTHEMEVRQTA